MTTPDPLAALTRRMAALGAEHFGLLDQVRRIADSAERTANGMDDLENTLTEVSYTAAETADAVASAMAARQAVLDTEVDAVPPAVETVATAELATRNVEDQVDAPAEDAVGGKPWDLTVLHAWVQEHIAPMVRKTTATGEGAGIRWCRQWWQHRDAVERFIALRMALTELSADESALWLSVYLRDHLDPHLSVLTSPYGPFYACTPRRHSATAEALGHVALDATPPQENPPSPRPEETWISSK